MIISSCSKTLANYAVDLARRPEARAEKAIPQSLRAKSYLLRDLRQRRVEEVVDGDHAVALVERVEQSLRRIRIEAQTNVGQLVGHVLAINVRPRGSFGCCSSQSGHRHRPREFCRRSAPANASAADDISLKGIEFPLRMIISPLSKVQRIERSVPRMEKGLTYCIISPNYDVDCLKQMQNEKGLYPSL